MMQHEEARLINRILQGHTHDYAVLVDRYKNLAFTIAFRIVNNREDAEEVTQDAFVKAFRHLGEFRNQSKFSTWLFRIVFNTAVSKKRLKKRDIKQVDEMSGIKETGYQPFDEDDPVTEMQLILEKAIKKLPEEDRVLITLFYIQEASVEEIHQITGLSRSNVKVRLFRARKKLQEIVGRITDHIIVQPA